MGNPDQKIVVVEKDILFARGDHYFEGFSPVEKVDYESVVLEYMKVMRRGSTKEPVNHPSGNAEMNTSYKQPIGYTIIANIPQKKVFAYQRSVDDKSYAEKRLQGRWSWGFGGHIEPLDMENGNPIRESILRELSEEVKIIGTKKLDIIGYVNEDVQLEEDSKLNRPSIGRVHFGILYLLSTDAPMLMIGDKEIARVELKTISELEELCKTEEVEGWSKIALESLRKIL